MSRFFKMPRFLRGSGNVSPTSGNVSLTYEDILTGFYARLKKLKDGEIELIDKHLGDRVRELAVQVNAQSDKQHVGKGPQLPTPAAPTTYGQLGRDLHGIMKRLGELEADRLVLPPSMEKRQTFRDVELSVRTPEEMADRRYLGVWGHYDPRDARKSDWRVIEANRFITKGQAIADASRERRWALIGIGVAFLMGIVAAGAAVLAIPTKDSIFCQLIPKLCDKGQDKPDAASPVGPMEPTANAAADKFVQAIRGRPTRSLSSAEREEIATIVKDKPKIDLEIKFDYNSAEINAKSLPSVQALGRALTNADLKGSTFVVAGHTDAAGGEAFNQDLSERRADAIKRYLVDKYGINGADLVTVGYGKSKLKDPSQPLSEVNRRVQVVNMENKATASK